MGYRSAKYYPAPVSESESLNYQHEDGDFTSAKERCNSIRCNSRQKLFLIVILVQAISLITVSASWYYSKTQLPPYQCPSRSPSTAVSSFVYSPAQDELEYELKVFEPAFGHTPYKGLSDEVDRVWKDLYLEHEVIKISRKEALLLANKTYPIRTEPGYYIGALDVFHQLHCLDLVRKALHPEYYINNSTQFTEEHISHCVDTIRQSLMCNADISIIGWKRSSELEPSERLGSQPFSPYFTQVRHCKNFEELKDWSRSRMVASSMKDLSSYLNPDNDLPDPLIIL